MYTVTFLWIPLVVHSLLFERELGVNMNGDVWSSDQTVTGVYSVI